jgi:hypothetical protein
MQDVDHGLAPGRRRLVQHGFRQRPMLGRLPWLALERRIRAFFFFVFFDMRYEPTVWLLCSPRGNAERW